MSKTTYTPQGRIIENENQGKVFSDLYVMFHELISSRELIWRLFLRDFKARYRQTVLGVLWAILMPIITVGIFVGMNRSGVFQAGEMKVPYPLFALVGVTIWGVFSTALSSACSSLINAGPMLVKINFPKISLVIASTGQGLVDLLIKAALVCSFIVWYGVFPDPVGPATSSDSPFISEKDISLRMGVPRLYPASFIFTSTAKSLLVNTITS